MSSRRRIFHPGWIAAVALLTIAGSAHAGVLTFVERMRDTMGGIDDLNGARGVAVSPDGKHVYVAADKDNAVTIFSRSAATGALTQLDVIRNGTDVLDSLAGARGATFSADGTFLYVAAGTADALAVFRRDATTGLLTFVQRKKDGIDGVNGLDGVASIAISADGAHLYVAGSADNAVAVFARDHATGEVAFVEMHREGVGGIVGTDQARAVAVSPDGRNVYSAGSGDDSVGVFRRDPSTGSLAFVEVQHDGAGGVDGLDGARGLAVSPDGVHVYVVGSIDDKMAVFRRNQATGALTFLHVYEDDDATAQIDGLNGAWAVALSPDGSRVYVVANVDKAVAVFQRDPATGLLTFLERHRDGLAGVDGLAGARAVAPSPDGLSLYACGFVGDAVVVFQNNAPCGNGVLDPGEQCDDGNLVAGDCCSPSCVLDTAGSACTDDGNGCTDDRCDGLGLCTHIANSAPCSDGAFCTVNDTCQAGQCRGTPRDCSAIGDQCNDGLCDETADACVAQARGDGAPCSDANACTQTDTCQAGACTGTQPVVCTALDPCHAAGACDPATGACAQPAQPDGTPCNDANECTVGESCQAGICAGATLVDRDQDGICDVRDVCPDLPNRDQADADQNGTGDACECTLPAPGRCLPGGGAKTTDCLLELNPAGPTTPNRTRTAVLGVLRCTDGDPTCDLDRTADGQCTFGVALCLANPDPRLPKCRPAAVHSFEVMAPNPDRARSTIDRTNALALEQGVGTLGLEIRRRGRVLSGGASSPIDRCSSLVRLTTPAPATPGGKPVRRKLVLRATADKRVDTDRVTLECRR